jgi:acyl carrier protein
VTTRERVIAILADKLGLEANEIEGLGGDGAMIMSDLGADSLSTTEIVMELEDEFGVGEITGVDTDEDRSVGDVVALIDKLLAQKK